MADKKALVEIEIAENFKPCENVADIYVKGDCPFNWTDYDMGCQTCYYEPKKDCPMLTLKFVE